MKQGHLYSRIKTAEYLKGQFIEDVPHWDGLQPQTEDPNNSGEFIDDPDIGITAKKPKPGCYVHVFDETTETWGEGLSQSELDAIQAEKNKQQAASELQAMDKDMARIAEDFYDYMMANDANFAAAMPQSVHDKIQMRKTLRHKL